MEIPILSAAICVLIMVYIYNTVVTLIVQTVCFFLTNSIRPIRVSRTCSNIARADFLARILFPASSQLRNTMTASYLIIFIFLALTKSEWCRGTKAQREKRLSELPWISKVFSWRLGQRFHMRGFRPPCCKHNRSKESPYVKLPSFCG